VEDFVEAAGFRLQQPKYCFPINLTLPPRTSQTRTLCPEHTNPKLECARALAVWSCRKKCDEFRPQCQRCRGKSLACTWPTDASQPIDGRRREGRRWSAPTRELDEHESLRDHFVTSVMPRLVRQNCVPECCDQSYLLRLAQEFPPLMAVLLAMAAADLGKDAVATARYLYTLRSLQDRMADAPDAGNEDGLLATAIFLCLFENLRPDAPPNTAVHIGAAGALLFKRQPVKALQGATQPAVVFERICIESFLYHSTLMMLFDPSLDGNPTGSMASYLASRMANNREDPTTQPILDEPYQFFLMIADVTCLARKSQPLNVIERQQWTRLQAGVLQYEQLIRADDPLKSLYVRAMRVLLLKTDCIRSAAQRTAEIRALGCEGLTLLSQLDLQRYLLSYALWPVAVIGAICLYEGEQRLVQGRIAPCTRMRRGQSVRLLARLKRIWASPTENQGDMIIRRLQILLDSS
ncbi:hypothetical protein N7474_001688, partial [Penicillium riverlandense]|uniref:uncharacterized protein n=1 Tax=Penicillium riverlandense TaxID=1903569 RepID=UPI00254860D5